MADKIEVQNELKLKMQFADNDDRTLILEDPKANLTAAQINAAATTLKTSNVFLGDKGGAAFVRFNSAKTVSKKTIKLDLAQ